MFLDVAALAGSHLAVLLPHLPAQKLRLDWELIMRPAFLPAMVFMATGGRAV
jgi:hypothetical protein